MPVGLSVTLIALAAVPAKAVTVQVDTFDIGAVANARRGPRRLPRRGGRVVSEGFESFRAWDGTSGTPTPIDGGVGLFRSESSVPGSGGSSVGGGQERRESARDVPLFGRQNLTEGGVNWLDSNDLEALIWEVDGGRNLQQPLLLLTDVGDIPGTDFNFSVAAGPESVTTHIPRQSNGTINFVSILFDGSAQHRHADLQHRA